MFLKVLFNQKKNKKEDQDQDLNLNENYLFLKIKKIIKLYNKKKTSHIN